jgi:hypothetical protein
LQRHIARIALALPLCAGTAAAQQPATEAPAAPASAAEPAAPAAGPAAPAAAPDKTAAPAALASPTAEPPPVDEDAPPPLPAAQDTAAPKQAAIPMMNLAGFQVGVSGFLGAQYTNVFEDKAQTDFVGRNDGFVLANARLIVNAKKDDVRILLALEGATDRRDARNTSSGKVEVSLRDAYVSYEPCRWFHARAGQFKPPFDAEELQSDTALLFIDRAVESRGVLGVEGYNATGLSLERQAGAEIESDPIYLSDDLPLGFAYYGSVTNGSGANEPLNDNDKLAYTGRLELYYGKYLTAGGGVVYDQVSTGVIPNQFDETHLGIAADLNVDVFGVLLSGQYMQQKRTFDDVSAQPDSTARGYHFQVGWRGPWGLIPAYRYAVYDPTADFDTSDPVLKKTLDVDEVTQHTIGLTWLVPDKPLKLQVNYTIAMEQKGRSIDNDRLDALVQATF